MLRKLFRRAAKRREARPPGEWELATLEQLLVEARRRVATLPPTRAAGRLAMRAITDETELLELLRRVRVQVCADFAGLARYDASGVHAILLALRQRELRRDAARSGAPVGVFR